ncbi:BSCL2 protein, partial [Crypturellus undulatus]|nr:BSCL2 protein [Crypturellus undulatus]
QAAVGLSAGALLLWLAAFLYGTFYYSYMPAVSAARAVHLAFRCVPLHPGASRCVPVPHPAHPAA